MRIIYFAAYVVLTVPLAVEAQEKRPKTMLLHYNTPSQYFDYHYGPEPINIPEMRAGSVGTMPPGCTYSFQSTFQKRWGVPQVQQSYVVVNVGCPCGTVRQLSFEISDTDKRFTKSKEGDVLVFEGKFRVVADRNLGIGGSGMFVVVGADNNASIFPAKKTPGPK